MEFESVTHQVSLLWLFSRQPAWSASPCPSIHMRWAADNKYIYTMCIIRVSSCHWLPTWQIQLMCFLQPTNPTLVVLSASEDSLLKDPGLSADDATGRRLQEVHGAAGHRAVQPRANGQCVCPCAREWIMWTFVSIGKWWSFNRMKLSSQEPDVEKLEKKINSGQIEEVIHQVGPCSCWSPLEISVGLLVP